MSEPHKSLFHITHVALTISKNACISVASDG